jgi:hypothetical protein
MSKINPEKEKAKQKRYMNLELATKLTEKTKQRLTNKSINDKKRLDDYLKNKN